jgi:hypothetical protein
MIPKDQEGRVWSFFAIGLRKVSIFFDYPIGKGSCIVLPCPGGRSY